MIEQIVRFLSLSDANVRYVLFGSMLLGTASGILGSFAILRKRSLLGDALAHAALPGVCLAFLVTGAKSMLPLLLGATVSGVLGVLVMQTIMKSARIKADAAIGIVLSVFFGIGIVLLTFIQRQPFGNQSGLDKFLFGQAAAMLPADLITMSIISAIILVLVVLFFKEFRLLTFDADFLATLGYPVTVIDLLLMGLIVLAVMVGLQAVGVILIAAMLITPAAGARFWTHRLSTMVILAGVFGAISGFLGTFISSLAPKIPTGPIMVLAATAFFILSAVFAPQRGILAKWLQHLNNKKRMDEEHVLRGYYELFEIGRADRVSNDDLMQHIQMSRTTLQRTIRRLERQGITRQDDGFVRLLSDGIIQAQNIVRTHRLWEYYLIHRARLRPDHVHRDADSMEHVLSAETLDRLERILQDEGIDTSEITSLHPMTEEPV